MRANPLWLGRSLLAVWRRVTNQSAWENAFFRGDRFFVAFGALYVRSSRWTSDIDTTLREHIPRMSRGSAFLRWGIGRPSQNPAVLIDGLGRFGNSIAQTLNALEIARKLRSRAVLYHRFDAIQNGTVDLGGDISLERVSPFLIARGRAPRIVWRTSAMTPAILFCNPCDESFEEPRVALRDATRVQEFSYANNRVDHELTIHVRGGDVFSHNPEEMYGQPPWAFYLRVLESQPWERVVLVSEDAKNPVVALIENWCLQHEIPILNSGDSFPAALHAISKGRYLVSSTGTFLPAIAFLAGGERVLFQFHVEPSPFVCKKTTSVRVVKDHSEHYVKSVMSHNWENSEIQKSLMVSYPRDNLSDVIWDEE